MSQYTLTAEQNGQISMHAFVADTESDAVMFAIKLVLEKAYKYPQGRYAKGHIKLMGPVGSGIVYEMEARA